MDLRDRGRLYLRAIEESDWATLEDLYDPSVIQEELPNRLLPGGATRDLGSIRDSFERGRQVLRGQRYHLRSIVVSGEDVAIEATWEGVLAVPVGRLGAGETMRARFAVFLTFREGRIIAQRNYDCFDAA